MDTLARLIPPARWRNICMALLIFTLVLIVLAYATGEKAFENASILCLAAAVGGTMGLWRCPRCRRILPLMDMMHRERCPKCSADIKNYNGR